MIHGSDNGPTCGFYPGTEPSRAGEQIDSELTPVAFSRAHHSSKDSSSGASGCLGSVSGAERSSFTAYVAKPQHSFPSRRSPPGEHS